MGLAQKWSEDRVYVVRHDHERKEMVEFTIEVVQGLDDDRSVIWRAQEAASHALVQPVLDLPPDEVGQLPELFIRMRRRMLLLPDLPDVLDFYELGLRKRIP